jgi:hypothetical protein
MESKVLITDSQYSIQDLLDKGWIIKSITAQHVASGGQNYSSSIIGKFLVIFERSKPQS